MDSARAVQMVAWKGGTRRFGSGYLVAADLVLTAAHVLGDAGRVSVRFVDAPGQMREVNAAAEFVDADVDVAVLRLDSAEQPAPSAVCFGYLTGRADCETVGFPRFKLNDDHRAAGTGTGTYRDSHHAVGWCSPGSNRYAGTLEIEYSTAGWDPEPDHSLWEGMSGAPVFADGLLIGVVAEHHRREGPNRLTATSVERWRKSLRAEDWRRLNELLNIPEGAALTAIGTPEVFVPVDGDTVTTLGPARLEVHNAADKDTNEAGRLPKLTAYLPRDHDNRLRAVLGEVIAGGPSRLVILTGESSTGKTRALYEALVDLAPDAPLLHPVGPKDLIDTIGLLAAGRIQPGCVLWLNEAQRFLYGSDGSEAAGRLRDVLLRTAGIAVVGTLWTNPYWRELTAWARHDAAYEQAKALLTHPSLAVRIDVPAGLGPGGLAAWRALTGKHHDPRLRDALNAGDSDGRVIQHLSGGPELLAAYLAGPGPSFTAREHALITAALDARRLGHQQPLPVALLAQAADGDLRARDRSRDPDWAETDLRALSEGERPDGTRTDIRNTLTAVTAVYARSGTPAEYEPADYLDQHARHMRVAVYGTPALWTALIKHAADPDDQIRLARSAWNLGLRTTAARLWCKAAAAGRPAWYLLSLGDGLDPDRRVATYCADRVVLTDAHAVATLLRDLREVGAEQALQTLLARNPEEHVDPADLSAVTKLLRVMGDVGATQRAQALAARAAGHVDPTDANRVMTLLEALRKDCAGEAVKALAVRAAEHADLADWGTVAKLLRALAKAEAALAVSTLAVRAVDHVDPSDMRAVDTLLPALRDAGAVLAVEVMATRSAEQVDISNARTVADLLWKFFQTGAVSAVQSLLARDPAKQVALTDPRAVASLLHALGKAGAGNAVATLLARDPAEHVDATIPYEVESLLRTLREFRAEQAHRVLATRAAEHVDITDLGAVVELLRVLREAGAAPAIQTLLARDPAEHVCFTYPSTVADLLRALRQVGAVAAVRTLLARNPAEHVDPTDPHDVTVMLRALREVHADQAALTLAVRAARDIDITAGVTTLLGTLRDIGAGPAVEILLARDPAKYADLNNLFAVRDLLQILPEVGAAGAGQALAVRAAENVDITSARAVADLLQTLWEAGAREAVQTLLDRNPTDHVDHGDSNAIRDLVRDLRKAGAGEAADALRTQSADTGLRPERFAPYGREPDGSTSPPWTLSSIILLDPA